MIEPKDGEWWMCDRGGIETVLLRKNNGWREDGIDTFDFRDAKPLYKMVKAEEPKPRTKVVYEKVEFNSFAEVASVYDDGDILYENGLMPSTLASLPIDKAVRLHGKKGYDLYRKVEKEIDWKGELKSYFGRDDLSNYSLGYVLDRKIDDAVSKGFIGMCHLVASLTDKPE